jgi:hypothetical protein
MLIRNSLGQTERGAEQTARLICGGCYGEVKQSAGWDVSTENRMEILSVGAPGAGKFGRGILQGFDRRGATQAFANRRKDLGLRPTVLS